MIFKINYLYKVLLLISCFCVNAQDFNSSTDDILFKGVIKQSHDNSCGIAALSVLINGTIENTHISEMDVINAIKNVSNGVGDDGYSLQDLQNAAEKLGYQSEWRKIEPNILLKIKQPVILLIGLNSGFPHFVVLKGIENSEAFLADSIRGNIRVSYRKLIQEGINKKYPAWYVMAINPSANKPQDSTLYLSPLASERYRSHMTVEQSNLITLTTIAKEGQFIVDYGFNASLGINNNILSQTKSENYVNNLNISYGVTENAEIGGSISYDINRQKTDFTGNTFITNGENRAYSLYFNNKFPLDENNRNGAVVGLSASLVENRSVLNKFVDEYTLFGGGINALGYANIHFAQLILGGSVNKAFSQNKLIDDSLAEYQVSGFISANKPFADRYLGSVGFAINDGHNKNNLDSEFQRSYLVSTSLSYVLSKRFQVSPSFSYSFGNGKLFSFGLDAAYIGRW